MSPTPHGSQTKPPTLGELFTTARKAQRYTRRHVADAAQVVESQYGRYETGVNVPTKLEIVERIAAFLGLDWELVFEAWKSAQAGHRRADNATLDRLDRLETATAELTQAFESLRDELRSALSQLAPTPPTPPTPRPAGRRRPS